MQIILRAGIIFYYMKGIISTDAWLYYVRYSKTNFPLLRFSHSLSTWEEQKLVKATHSCIQVEHREGSVLLKSLMSLIKNVFCISFLEG